jgi:hypothetical protein
VRNRTESAGSAAEGCQADVGFSPFRGTEGVFCLLTPPLMDDPAFLTPPLMDDPTFFQSGLRASAFSRSCFYAESNPQDSTMHRNR